MIYTIVNPSDAYTMKTDDPEAAAIACMFLGNGHYGLNGEDGSYGCPIFLFGGHDEWLLAKFGRKLDEAIKEKLIPIAEALESVLIGDISERREFDEAAALMSPENAQQFREKRHDMRRSSMNNIGARAKALAQQLRRKATATVAV